MLFKLIELFVPFVKLFWLGSFLVDSIFHLSEFVVLFNVF